MTQPPTVGDVIAERVRMYRDQRDWSVRRLAEECAKRGATQLTAASLGNIERGVDPTAKRKRRDVTVEELLVLAYVLDVPPVMLMLPLGDSNAVEICPGASVEPYRALRWMMGEFPILEGRSLEDPPITYRREESLIWHLRQIDGILSEVAFTRRLFYGDPEPILAGRRRFDSRWESYPEFRPYYEDLARKVNEPPPGSPMSDEEYVAEVRKGLLIRYEEQLRQYSAQLWAGFDAGLKVLPPIPRQVYDDLVALTPEPSSLPDYIDPTTNRLMKRQGTVRPMLPPGVEVSEAGWIPFGNVWKDFGDGQR